MGLDGALRAKGNRFIGILNGIDPDVWDPANDPALAAPYSRQAPAGKAACRRDLLTRVGFDPDDDGVGARDDRADGSAEGLRPARRRDAARCSPAGRGWSCRAAATRRSPIRSGRWRRRGPRRSPSSSASTATMARRIYAGVDLFLMPSRFEPCGQGQMIALRYGTPPVVRRTGGLADSVVDVTAQPDEGTGFVFDAATPAALVAAIERAATMRDTDPAAWAALRDRGMAVDFRWDTGPAPRYLAAYRRAIALRRGEA